jgi:hypothetical protein
VTSPTSSPAPDAAVAAALIAELGKKTGVCWLTYERYPGAGVSETHAVWHVWLQDALYVVSDGTEQPLPGIASAERVEVTMRSKENGGRLLTWVATASAVLPDDELWEPVTAALVASRLNLPDLQAAAAGWARSSRVTRLAPTGDLVESPGALSDDAHLATPKPTPATTRGRLPKVLHRRVKRRPKLS